MKATQLRGRAIVSLAEASKIGVVDDLLLDLSNKQIGGIITKSGLFKKSEGFPASLIMSIGQDAITVANKSVINETVKYPELDQYRSLTSFINNKVITVSGTLIGEINNVILDDTGLTITGFELAGGLWSRFIRRDRQLGANEITSYGANMVIIADEVANRLDNNHEPDILKGNDEEQHPQTL